MKEILTIFMDYCGSGIYPFLFLLSLVYLFATEKDRKIRLVLLETSAVILLLFFFPLRPFIHETRSWNTPIGQMTEQ